MTFFTLYTGLDNGEYNHDSDRASQGVENGDVPLLNPNQGS